MNKLYTVFVKILYAFPLKLMSRLVEIRIGKLKLVLRQTMFT